MTFQKYFKSRWEGLQVPAVEKHWTRESRHVKVLTCKQVFNKLHQLVKTLNNLPLQHYSNPHLFLKSILVELFLRLIFLHRWIVLPNHFQIYFNRLQSSYNCWLLCQKVFYIVNKTNYNWNVVHFIDLVFTLNIINAVKSLLISNYNTLEILCICSGFA